MPKKRKTDDNGELRNCIIKFRVTTSYYNTVTEFCKKNDMTISEALELGLNNLIQKSKE